MQTTTAYGYPTNFFSWSDGQNSPIRQITLTTPQTLSAIYNTPLTFQNLAGGLGSNLFSVGYWATGTITTIHGTPIPNITIQTTWNPQDILERTATTQTTTDGTFNTQTYIGPMATTVYAIDFTITNPPTGYQPQTTHRHYP